MLNSRGFIPPPPPPQRGSLGQLLSPPRSPLGVEENVPLLRGGGSSLPRLARFGGFRFPRFGRFLALRARQSFVVALSDIERHLNGYIVPSPLSLRSASLASLATPHSLRSASLARSASPYGCDVDWWICSR